MKDKSSKILLLSFKKLACNFFNYFLSTEFFYQEKINLLENLLVYYEIENKSLTVHYDEFVSNLNQKISVLEEKLRFNEQLFVFFLKPIDFLIRLKKDEAEKEKSLRFELIQRVLLFIFKLIRLRVVCKLNEQQEYISKIESDKSVFESHLSEMEKIVKI